MAGRSRATSPIPNCGPSATTARPGSIYLRQRNRSTQSERALHQQAIAFHVGPDPVRIRRMLERPFGSVRWKKNTPDRAANEVAAGVAKRRGAAH